MLRLFAPMQTVYIKFLDEQARRDGFYELTRRFRVTSLPSKVYQVPIQSLDLLEQKAIGFRRASDDEMRMANDQIRNPVATLL